MTSKQSIIDVIAEQGILPLYFNPDETVSIEVLRAIYRAGIMAVEYTNRGDAALANFKKMVQVRNNEMPGLLLGVGTIKSLSDAENYMAANADFMVSPGFIPEVAIYAKTKIGPRIFKQY
jgi:2-dehydro-3-deoxyphosphogluconate aldolase/(4S)-4-hydroxy-2-oxoglutarate aldolase